LIRLQVSYGVIPQQTRISMPLRFIASDDLNADQTWQLAQWCLAQGADEIGMTLMWLQGSEKPFVDRFVTALGSHRVPEAARPHMLTYVGQDVVRPAELWTASTESLAILKEFFRDGLFTYMTSYHSDGWLENPTFYREGEIMLGVVSHEGEGYLDLTALEAVQIAALGIPTRDKGTWI
jgi:hypothetical protein